MPSKFELLQEAYNRNLLPPDKKAMFEELLSRQEQEYAGPTIGPATFTPDETPEATRLKHGIAPDEKPTQFADLLRPFVEQIVGATVKSKQQESIDPYYKDVPYLSAVPLASLDVISKPFQVASGVVSTTVEEAARGITGKGVRPEEFKKAAVGESLGKNKMVRAVATLIDAEHLVSEEEDVAGMALNTIMNPFDMNFLGTIKWISGLKGQHAQKAIVAMEELVARAKEAVSFKKPGLANDLVNLRAEQLNAFKSGKADKIAQIEERINTLRGSFKEASYTKQGKAFTEPTGFVAEGSAYATPEAAKEADNITNLIDEIKRSNFEESGLKSIEEFQLNKKTALSQLDERLSNLQASKIPAEKSFVAEDLMAARDKVSAQQLELTQRKQRGFALSPKEEELLVNLNKQKEEIETTLSQLEGRQAVLEEGKIPTQQFGEKIIPAGERGFIAPGLKTAPNKDIARKISQAERDLQVTKALDYKPKRFTIKDKTIVEVKDSKSKKFVEYIDKELSSAEAAAKVDDLIVNGKNITNEVYKSLSTKNKNKIWEAVSNSVRKTGAYKLTRAGFMSGEATAPKVGPEGEIILKGIKEGYSEKLEVLGREQKKFFEAIDSLTDAQFAAATRVKEGGITKDPVIQKAANILDDIDREIAVAYKEIKPGFVPKENYWVHKPKEEFFTSLTKEKGYNDYMAHLKSKGLNNKQAGEYVEQLIKRKSEKFVGSLDAERLDLIPDQYIRRDKAAFLENLEESWEKIIDAKNFGFNGEKLYAYADKVVDQTDSKFLKDIIDYTLDRKVKGTYDKYFQKIRAGETMIKLDPISSLMNWTQRLNILPATNLKSFFRGLKSVYTKTGKMDATESGVLSQYLMTEAIQNVMGTSGGSLSAKYLKYIAFLKTEQGNRIASANAGRFFAEDVFNAWKKGGFKNKYKSLILEDLGVDVAAAKRNGALTKKDLVRAAQQVTSDVNFFSRPIDVPVAWGSQGGKTLSQFKSAAFQQTRFIKKVFANSIRYRSPMGPIYLLAAAQASGEVVGGARSFVNQRDRPSWDDDQLGRALHNFSYGMGFGIMSDVIYSAMYGEKGIYGAIAGPAVGDAVSIADALVTDFFKPSKKAKIPMEKTAMKALKSVPFGLGKPVERYYFKKDKKKKSSF